jgi:hypothetical protein
MILKFGLELAEQVFPAIEENEDLYCAESSLLSLLETYLGIGAPEKLDFLRVEQYRQTLQQYLSFNADAFFAASFKADALSTADALLQRRDELKLAGFDFEPEPDMPVRLEVFTALEKLLNLLPNPFFAGFADRFEKVLTYLDEELEIPIKEIRLIEPLQLLPPHLKRLFGKLQKRAVIIREEEYETKEGNSDLDILKKSLSGRLKGSFQANADGSLIILKATSDNFAAAFLSKLFKLNKEYRPLCLLSDKNRALDNAFIQEGLPSFGVLSASLSRPTLQILKLAPAFLWSPVNPYKLLEFLSLPNIPLARGLAFRLAAAVSEKPGIFNNIWFAKKMIISTISMQKLNLQKKKIS